MASIDIREHIDSEVDEIIFADEKGDDGFYQARSLSKCAGNDGDKYIQIEDFSNGRVWVNSVEHANNLIDAIKHAIHLGWIE